MPSSKYGLTPYWINPMKTSHSLRLNNPRAGWAADAMSNIRKRCIKHSREYSIDREWLERNAPVVCPISGVVLDYTAKGGQGPRANSPTVDRIDNERGYTADNVIIVANSVNSRKGRLSLRDLLWLAQGYALGTVTSPLAEVAARYAPLIVALGISG